jgi:hypothetical protein
LHSKTPCGNSSAETTVLYTIYGVVLPFCFILEQKKVKKTMFFCILLKTGFFFALPHVCDCVPAADHADLADTCFDNLRRCPVSSHNTQTAYREVEEVEKGKEINGAAE